MTGERWSSATAVAMAPARRGAEAVDGDSGDTDTDIDIDIDIDIDRLAGGDRRSEGGCGFGLRRDDGVAAA